MTIYYWIALGIVAVALIGLIIAAVVIGRRMTKSLGNVPELLENIQNTQTYFEGEATYLKDALEDQKHRVDKMMVRLQAEADAFQDILSETQQIQTNIDDVKSQETEIMQAVSDKAHDYIKYNLKNDWADFKVIAHKTFIKQKERYKRS